MTSSSTDVRVSRFKNRSRVIITSFCDAISGVVNTDKDGNFICKITVLKFALLNNFSSVKTKKLLKENNKSQLEFFTLDTYKKQMTCACARAAKFKTLTFELAYCRLLMLAKSSVDTTNANWHDRSFYTVASIVTPNCPLHNSKVWQFIHDCFE